MAAYCTKDDLLIGDIPLAPKYGDGTQFVQMAADEIDSQLGHLYVTPIEVEDLPANRPTTLLLKKTNQLLASGRLILDMAAGGEDRELQQYGLSMLNEALGIIKAIQDGKIKLTGAEPAEDVADDENTGPSIVNEDPYSLVEGFYQKYSTPSFIGAGLPLKPYGDS